MRFRKTLIAAALVTLVAGAGTLASDSAIDRGIGRPVPDFTLLDTGGKEVHLYGYAGKKAVVAVFIGTGCPLSDLYLPRLNELARKYKPAGVVVLAIDSNRGENAAAVAGHIKKFGLSFPVLIDTGNIVADTFQAESTCEALVIDGRARLRYRGAIDDQYSRTGHKDRPDKSFLIDAIDAVVAGRAVKVEATPVDGCPLVRDDTTIKPITGPRVRAKTPEDPQARTVPMDVGRVNYAADVAPIVQNKCQQCHRVGQVGPFPLLDYEQVRSQSATIREVVAERRMPPWHADPRYGHFSNDRSLSLRERAIILAWVDQGMPPGDLKQAPPNKTFPEGWAIGKPDFVFTMPQPCKVAAKGLLPYQYFRVPTGFKEDTWVQAAEARPGDRSVVHHILVSIDDHKGARPDEGGDGYFVAYAPGDIPTVYPEGTAKLIPAGSDLIFQVHYTPIGTAKVDCSSVAVVVAKAPVKQRAVTIGVSQEHFAIPPGHENYAVQSNFTVPFDTELLSLFPHMHLRGKSFLYTATYPDGTSEVLLSVPAYDFGWQSVYRLSEPKRLPRGTRLRCLAHFDNSPKNPANPDPTKTVRWGDQTFEEMMIGYFDCVIEPPAAKKAAAASGAEDRPPFSRRQ